MLVSMTWMLYGANGYTGTLVAELAMRRGERPVLAGRSVAKIAAVADRLGMDYRAVDLDEPTALAAALDGIDVVAHCAGPFSRTSRPMVNACLATGTHYLDITGEIDVFEEIYARDAEACRAGVVLLPGAGFDVVPTDCVAASLARAMPDATHLDLAFRARMDFGPGTARTAIEGAGIGGRERVDGALTGVPLAHRRIVAGFPSGPTVVTSIPWGDVGSAYRTTGIPNIVTYTVVPGGALFGVGNRLAGPLLRSEAVRRTATLLVDRVMAGRKPATGRGGSQVWGQVRSGEGRRMTMRLAAPAPLTLTADSVLRSVGRLRDGTTVPGSHTPSTAFGVDFALQCDGVRAGEPQELSPR